MANPERVREVDDPLKRFSQAVLGPPEHHGAVRIDPDPNLSIAGEIGIRGRQHAQPGPLADCHLVLDIAALEGQCGDASRDRVDLIFRPMRGDGQVFRAQNDVNGRTRLLLRDERQGVSAGERDAASALWIV